MEKQDQAVLLSKLQFPIARTELEVDLVGCFGCPEEWKTTDQANPGTFTYTSRFMTSEFVGGKISPRQPSEKEVRQQQEAIKKKAPPKKQVKDPQEEQRARKLKQEQAQFQLQRQESESKLSEQERFHIVSEDPYRAFSVRFQPRVKQMDLSQGSLLVFEERVSHDSGEWFYLYKYPVLAEEELAKLRKGKPKNLNLNDLNPVTMRAWVDLSSFKQPGQTELQLRCKFEQVEESPDTSRPNLEKTYVLIKLRLADPLQKVSDDSVQVSSQDLIRPYPTPQPTPADVEAVEGLQSQIKIIVESIAMQFSQMYWQEFEQASRLRSFNCLSLADPSDIPRRSQQFLYQFNVKGMYKLMKERIKKAIVKVCKSKYAQKLKGYSSFTGVSFEVKDQFYSEIYNFLIDQYQKVLKEIIQQNKEDLYLTSVVAPRVSRADTGQFIKQRIDETDQQRVTRLAAEYESIRDTQAANSLYLEAVKSNQIGEGLELKFQYVKFCLRNNMSDADKLTAIVYEVLQGSRQSAEATLLYTLLLFATKKQGECRQGWVFLRDLIDRNPTSIEYLILASVIFENYLVDKELSLKFHRLAQRTVQKQLHLLPPNGQYKDSPSPSQLPTLKVSCQYTTQLEPQLRDEKLFTPLLNMLQRYNMFELVELVLPKISNQSSPYIQYLDVMTAVSKNNTQYALQKALDLNSKTPSFQMTSIITRISFQSSSYQMCEEYIKKMFRFRQAADWCQDAYLQLAFIYYSKAQFSNSKACLAKLLELNRNNSQGWLKLGNTMYQLNNIESAVDCLRQANVLNPNNPLTWFSLCEAYIRLKKMNIANGCLINYLNLGKKKGDITLALPLVQLLSNMDSSSDNNRYVAGIMTDNIYAAQ